MSAQVLVTGITGFIAKHVALSLLKSGYRVRGTLRQLGGADDVRRTLSACDADVSRLSFVEADLTSDTGWEEALTGCDYVQHVASPFPMKQPRDRYALVPMARDGTLRVLKAARAADVKRIILTSSVAAMMYRAKRGREIRVRESDWTDPNWKTLSAYRVSKTFAERAAWEWSEETGWKERLAVINPGFVLGPTLDGQTGTSLGVIKLILQGAYPAFPPAAFPVVDVRDLAQLHAEAMTSSRVGGRRLIGAADTLSMKEMGEILRGAFPDRANRIPHHTVPAFLVRLLANFDRALKSVVPDLGVTPIVENAYVTELTGVKFRPAADAVRAAGQSLIDFSVV